MAKLKVLSERASAALFAFLLVTSCSKTCLQWECAKIDTSSPCFDFSKAYLTPECDLRGVELEISKTSCNDLVMYLNVFTLNVERDASCSDKALVNLLCNHETISFFADVLEGGQRMIVPQEIADIIISTLLSETPITIYFGRYRSEITPQGFSKAYYSL